MVASDTVVGLVGAGILLVALVGVFVYESQQGQGGSADLENAEYSTKVDSTISHRAPSGNQLPANQCAPQPPATSCVTPQATVDVTLTGLPSPGNLRYVVFLEGGGSAVAVGEATAIGDTYKTGQKQVPGDHRSKDKIVVSLETSGSATTPTWKILTVAASGGTADAVFITSAGNHTLSFTTSGSQTVVDARLEDVQNKTGYTYRGWMVSEDESGRNYTFVGNFTPDSLSTGAEMDGTINGRVPGARLDYMRFIVTIEPIGSSPGLRPAGPPVIVSDYNAPAPPSPQK